MKDHKNHVDKDNNSNESSLFKYELFILEKSTEIYNDVRKKLKELGLQLTEDKQSFFLDLITTGVHKKIPKNKKSLPSKEIVSIIKEEFKNKIPSIIGHIILSGTFNQKDLADINKIPKFIDELNISPFPKLENRENMKNYELFVKENTEFIIKKTHEKIIELGITKEIHVKPGYINAISKLAYQKIPKLTEKISHKEREETIIAYLKVFIKNKIKHDIALSFAHMGTPSSYEKNNTKIIMEYIDDLEIPSLLKQKLMIE